MILPLQQRGNGPARPAAAWSRTRSGSRSTYIFSSRTSSRGKQGLTPQCSRTENLLVSSPILLLDLYYLWINIFPDDGAEAGGTSTGMLIFIFTGTPVRNWWAIPMDAALGLRQHNNIIWSNYLLDYGPYFILRARVARNAQRELDKTWSLPTHHLAGQLASAPYHRALIQIW